MKKLFDILTLVIICAAFAVVTLLNMFQTRLTESASENRSLADFPEFNIQVLLDGSFFKGVELFVSDTFIFREQLVTLSKQIETLRGADLFLSSDDDFRFIPVAASETNSFKIDIPEITVAETIEYSVIESDTDEIIINITETTAETEDLTLYETGTKTEPLQSETTAETEDQTKSLQPETVAKSEIEPGLKIDGIKLDSMELYLSIGSSQTLNASVIPVNIKDVMISWTTSNSKVASLTVRNDRLFINGVGTGNAVITASAGGVTALCNVTVQASNKPPAEGNTSQIITEEPEILTNGLIIYRDAVYSIPYLVEKSAGYFAQTVDYYASLFSKSKISVVIAPLSSAMLDRDTFGKRLTDQKSIISTIGSYMNDSINNVEIYDALWAHRDEYLYFKSDHHWTARGAYYAYAEFAKSVGFEPVGIDKLEERLLNNKMQGTMYGYTGDERVKKIYDSLYVYIPRKAHTMTVYKNGTSYSYDSSILTAFGNYGCFIASDNAYTIINVPENPQDINIMVLKDSYGNAMTPYLTEHYGNIIVVDPRHVTFNIYDLLKDYPLRDILFLNDIYNPNVYSWTLNLLRSVGVN